MRLNHTDYLACPCCPTFDEPLGRSRARAEAKAEVQSQLADTDDGTIDYSACDDCADGERGDFGLCAACECGASL